MTIKEYLEVSNFITESDVEVDVWRKDTDGKDTPLNLETLTVGQLIKRKKLKNLEIKSVDIYPSGCGSWGGFVRLDINVK